MPELPEVESLRLSLLDNAVGRRVIGCETILPRVIRQGNLEWLNGHRLEGARRFGKLLALDFSGGKVVAAHMRMSGTLLWLSAPSQRDKFARAVIHFDGGELVYRDPRTLGGLWISDEISPQLMPKGVDPLDSGFTVEYLTALFKSRGTPVKLALLNQDLIAGLGNIYAAEALWSAGVHPARPVSHLTDMELSKLHAAIRDLLRAAIAARGTTFRDFKLDGGRSGGFQSFLKVYGRESQPCPRCGASVQRIRQGQRSTFFCAGCQV